jgi:hypothetical protein
MQGQKEEKMLLENKKLVLPYEHLQVIGFKEK